MINKLIPLLKKAKVIRHYKLFVEFEDGVSGIIDLSNWKGKGVFELWNDEKNFEEYAGNKQLLWNYR